MIQTGNHIMNSTTRILAVVFAIAVSTTVFAQTRMPERFSGLSDASAVEDLDGGYLAVAGDEDNVIHVYRHGLGSAPVFKLNLADFLRVSRKVKEADLEGAARIGSRIYWITSHGRDSKGKLSPSRHRFFATTATVSNRFAAFQPVGRPYCDLVSDLIRDPRLRAFDLASAATLAPKQAGGLNIEGLAATPEGHLLIGFRNPIPGGKALIVPLLNPAEVVEGVRARFGDPILLEMGWLGIRSITSKDGKYWIIAGSHAQSGISRLYVWDGSSSRPELVLNTQLTGLNPEAITWHDLAGEEHLFVASDDGSVKLGNTPLKKIKEPSLRHFRAVWLQP
jgi:hypothetical protein